MSFYATLILALALSMDAFAVAICKGAVLHKPFREILVLVLFLVLLKPLHRLLVGVSGS